MLDVKVEAFVTIASICFNVLGIQWSNLFTPVTPDDDLTVGAIMLMLILDCIIYLGVAMYVENVFPGEFGVALPWNYPFTKSYWFPKSEKIGKFNFLLCLLNISI